MSLFAQLNQEAARRGLRFIVIGAHAVIEHGFQRGTEDADILVSKNHRAAWIESVTSLGYRVLYDGGTFLQFEPVAEGNWDLDLMLVPEGVFERLMAASQPARMEGAAVVVPSLEHLLALKVHALKNGRGLRVLKDLTDVAQLISVNRVDPQSPWLRAVFEKHGNQEIYERVRKLLA